MEGQVGARSAGNELRRYLILVNSHCMDFLDDASGKEPPPSPQPTNVGDVSGVGLTTGSGRSPGVGTATPSSILAWRIPWTGEFCALQSMVSQTVRHS